jgi:hypothetical protein
VTGTNFDDVDLDRLADYVGGALHGTPEAATVAHLVATDPRWTRAHAELVAADALVRADLAVLAGEPETMPGEVAARLDAALTVQRPSAAATAPGEPLLSVLPGGKAGLGGGKAGLGSSKAGLPGGKAGLGSGKAGLGAGSGARHDGAGATVQRRWRSLVGIAAAVVVLGLGTVSLVAQLGNGGQPAKTSDAAGSAAEQVPRAQPPGTNGTYAYGAPGSPGLNASGTDYSDTALAMLGVGPVAAEGRGPAETDRHDALPAPSSQSVLPAAAVPDALRPLTEPGALAGCVKAIVNAYGGAATLLDYARYRGDPALVVVLDGAHGISGSRWVVVVGPKCGIGGTIADERYNARIG